MAMANSVDGLSGNVGAADQIGGGCCRGGRRVVICFISELGCTSVRWKVAADRSIQTPASCSTSSTSQHGRESEKDGQMRIVTEHSVGQLAAGTDDLAGNLDERVKESPKLHPEPSVALGSVFAPPARHDGRPQAAPLCPTDPGVLAGTMCEPGSRRFGRF